MIAVTAASTTVMLASDLLRSSCSARCWSRFREELPRKSRMSPCFRRGDPRKTATVSQLAATCGFCTGQLPQEDGRSAEERSRLNEQTQEDSASDQVPSTFARHRVRCGAGRHTDAERFCTNTTTFRRLPTGNSFEADRLLRWPFVPSRSPGKKRAAFPGKPIHRHTQATIRVQAGEPSTALPFPTGGLTGAPPAS